MCNILFFILGTLVWEAVLSGPEWAELLHLKLLIWLVPDKIDIYSETPLSRPPSIQKSLSTKQSLWSTFSYKNNPFKRESPLKEHFVWSRGGLV